MSHVAAIHSQSKARKRLPGNMLEGTIRKLRMLYKWRGYDKSEGFKLFRKFLHTFERERRKGGGV